MQYWWMSAAVLALTCWWGSTRLMAVKQPPAYLIAVTLALLGLASTVGAVKYGLQWQERLDPLHFHAAHAFGVAGLYLLGMALLDWIDWLRLHKGLWLAHLADAALLFALGLWLNLLPVFQAVLVVVVNLMCLLVAGSLWRLGRLAHAKWLAFAAMLFIFTVAVISRDPEPMQGLALRMHLYHLLLALWVYCITEVIRHPAERLE